MPNSWTGPLEEMGGYRHDDAPNVGACYRAGLLDGAQRAEQDKRDWRPVDAIADELTEEARHYGTTAQKGSQSHRAYRALLLGTARGYRQELN